jgi:hypothetical protein
MTLFDLSVVKKKYFCHGLGPWGGIVAGFSLIQSNHNVEVDCRIFLAWKQHTP